MITKNLQRAINSQINAELWSAYLYLAMSLDAERKSLKGISNWFWVQWLEEQDHARIFQKYLSDMDAQVILEPIKGVQTEWGTPIQMFKETLKHEQEVTALINNIVKMAREQGDNETLSRLQWFIDEQIEEEANARDLIATLELLADSNSGLYMFDRQLAEREYKKATPLLEE
ncbi:MAG: ferritin [Paludibacteraceae bacterium]|nr:ferritin [Paludibacteraceae bacterium]